MTLNNTQIFDSVTVLSRCGDEKGMLGYAISRNKAKLMAEVQEYSRKRDELLKEYGEDLGNGQFQLTSEAAEKFYEELKPYSDLTVDVPIMQIPLDVFCGGNLTSDMMSVLQWMVKEE